MKTDLCKMLDIELPILQAAIGGISNPALAAAVSNAGGLGAIAMTGWGYDGTQQRLRRAADLTNKGIVANLLLSYNIEEEFAAILDHPPRVVSFFWGDIAPYAKRVHDAGALVMASVGSVEEAKAAVHAGADIIVAQGWEAGGHVRGTTATLALIPAVVDAVDPVPVVAAGGIADGRGLAAVLALGAQGAWIGTRFLAADEADIHPAYQDKVLAAGTGDTFYSKLYDVGWPDAPGRVLRNRTVDEWEAAGRPGTGHRPGEGEIIARDGAGGAIRRYEATAMRADCVGAPEDGPLWAGQGVGLVTKRQPAAQIVADLAAEARSALKKAAV